MSWTRAIVGLGVLGAHSIGSTVFAGDFVHSYRLRFERGSFPALYVSADGEGCCNFSAEMAGTFRLNIEQTLSAAWISEASVMLHSAMTWRLGQPITDPTDRLFHIGPEWLNGKMLSERARGILSEVPGEAVTPTLFTFGPHMTDDRLYRWNYTIELTAHRGRLRGESLFNGDDGDYNYIDVPLLVVPEPATVRLILTTGAVLAAPILCRLRHRSSRRHYEQSTHSTSRPRPAKREAFAACEAD